MTSNKKNILALGRTLRTVCLGLAVTALTCLESSVVTCAHAERMFMSDGHRPQVGRGAYQMRARSLFGCGTELEVADVRDQGEDAIYRAVRRDVGNVGDLHVSRSQLGEMAHRLADGPFRRLADLVEKITTVKDPDLPVYYRMQ